MKKLFLTLSLILLSTIAWSADKAIDGWAHIGYQVLELLIPALVTIVVTVIGTIVYRYFGVKLTNEQTNLMEHYASKAVDYVDQKVKSGNINKSDRLQIAAEIFIKLAGKKVTKKMEEKAKHYIEAHLGGNNAYKDPPITNEDLNKKLLEKASELGIALKKKKE